MRSPVLSGRFKKDVSRQERRGKDMGKLKRVILLLLQGESLPPALRDHPLKGDWRGFRELHVEPDWLLIYRTVGDEVQLARTGTHSDLFDE